MDIRIVNKYSVALCYIFMFRLDVNFIYWALKLKIHVCFALYMTAIEKLLVVGISINVVQPVSDIHVHKVDDNDEIKIEEMVDDFVCHNLNWYLYSENDANNYCRQGETKEGETEDQISSYWTWLFLSIQINI